MLELETEDLFDLFDFLDLDDVDCLSSCWAASSQWLKGIISANVEKETLLAHNTMRGKS